jgi:4,5-DOPA dioxygenase extradiol
MPKPRTIHDFGGFPRELFECQYPAPGDPDLAKRVQQLLAPIDVTADQTWGLDHGTWAVLCHVFPSVDVPIVQLSIDKGKAGPFHYEIGRKLRTLRDEGILIMGSGDIVHNLHTYAWGGHPVEPYDWALRFESKAREFMLAGSHQPLIHYDDLGSDALLSIPTPEHYLPLLYVLGASFEGEGITFPVEGIDGGSVSMLTIQFG